MEKFRSIKDKCSEDLWYCWDDKVLHFCKDSLSDEDHIIQMCKECMNRERKSGRWYCQKCLSEDKRTKSTIKSNFPKTSYLKADKNKVDKNFALEFDKVWNKIKSLNL